MKKSVRALTWMLSCLTLLFMSAQIAVFYIHAQGASLIDSLVNSSVAEAILYPSVFIPLLQFAMLQLLACVMLIVWARTVAITLGRMFSWRSLTCYWFGLGFWLVMCLLIFALNHELYSHSFFASWIDEYRYGDPASSVVLAIAMMFVGVSTILVVYYLLGRGLVFLSLGILVWVGYQHHEPVLLPAQAVQPNIIVIGLDSLRPDFVNKNATPAIDAFLESGTVFENTYTPFARTYPSWMSILTGKHPVHHGARFNLADATQVLQNDMLSKRLHEAGYVTVYATDEARFSDIHAGYGFDAVVRPARGLPDFILGGLTDFPLTNLLINLPGGQWLFPYNYANRAAQATYQPEQFLRKVDRALRSRDRSRPLFLAVHLCLTHWPFTWAGDGDTTDYLPAKYELSVEAVDAQLNQLLKVLNKNGLLQHSLVVLLSDHGTAVGLPDDRVVKEENFVGDKIKIKQLTVSKLSSAPEFSWHPERDFTINTSYGQGTDVLSLKQYQSLLAIKGYGVDIPKRKIKTTVSLMDVAPTILDYLKLPVLTQADGISLYGAIRNGAVLPLRPMYIETGETVDGMVTDNIEVARILHNALKAYRVDRATAAVVMTAMAMRGGMQNKQYAVILGDQMLAQYPPSYAGALVSDPGTGEAHVEAKVKPGYFVTVNLRTGKWHFGADKGLRERLQGFFGARRRRGGSAPWLIPRFREDNISGNMRVSK